MEFKWSNRVAALPGRHCTGLLAIAGCRNVPPTTGVRLGHTAASANSAAAPPVAGDCRALHLRRMRDG